MFVISSGSLPPFMLTAFGRPWPAVCALIPPPRVVSGDSDELCRAHTANSSSLQASAVCVRSQQSCGGGKKSFRGCGAFYKLSLILISWGSFYIITFEQQNLS